MKRDGCLGPSAPQGPKNPRSQHMPRCGGGPGGFKANGPQLPASQPSSALLIPRGWRDCQSPMNHALNSTEIRPQACATAGGPPRRTEIGPSVNGQIGPQTGIHPRRTFSAAWQEPPPTAGQNGAIAHPWAIPGRWRGEMQDAKPASEGRCPRNPIAARSIKQAPSSDRPTNQLPGAPATYHARLRSPGGPDRSQDRRDALLPEAHLRCLKVASNGLGCGSRPSLVDLGIDGHFRIHSINRGSHHEPYRCLRVPEDRPTLG